MRVPPPSEGAEREGAAGRIAEGAAAGWLSAQRPGLPLAPMPSLPLSAPTPCPYRPPPPHPAPPADPSSMGVPLPFDPCTPLLPPPATSHPTPPVPPADPGRLPGLLRRPRVYRQDRDRHRGQQVLLAHLHRAAAREQGAAGRHRGEGQAACVPHPMQLCGWWCLGRRGRLSLHELAARARYQGRSLEVHAARGTGGPSKSRTPRRPLLLSCVLAACSALPAA